MPGVYFLDMKPINQAIEDRFFADYDDEQAIISKSLSCLNLVAYEKLINEYGEDKLFSLLCTNLKTNVNPGIIFKHLKNLPIGIDFI